jgi:uncharacterized protein YndB with AHSA1/START domain
MSTATHSSFTINRQLPGSPTHAWRFWADPQLKQRWTSCHPDWVELEQVFDFRAGGHERSRLRAPDGKIQSVEMHYLDLLPGQRIVYAYTMHVDETPLSASLVTIALLPHAGGTRMVYTEALAMLGAGEAALRQQGTEGGFDRLVLEMERDLATVQ